MSDEQTITLTRSQVAELRAIIHDKSLPLGNRLQGLSARLYFALKEAGWATLASRDAAPAPAAAGGVTDGEGLMPLPAIQQIVEIVERIKGGAEHWEGGWSGTSPCCEDVLIRLHTVSAIWKRRNADYENVVKQCAALAQPAPVQQEAEAIADAVVRMVGEMDDRTSPEDWPEAMLVTGPELHAFILLAFERAALTPPAVAAPARVVVDVHDFGAKGDGVTDDTAAVQRAVDALAQIAAANAMAALRSLTEGELNFVRSVYLGVGRKCLEWFNYDVTPVVDNSDRPVALGLLKLDEGQLTFDPFDLIVTSDGWRPIATVPRDDSEFLVGGFDNDGKFHQAISHNENPEVNPYRGWNHRNGPLRVWATHWKPLDQPAAPAQAGETK